jgi:uncharacterized protein YjbI with pentapeptide repeats
LIGANLEQARLLFADFSSTNLSRARFVNADITSAVFTEATLDNTQWVNRRRCRPGSIGECK